MYKNFSYRRLFSQLFLQLSVHDKRELRVLRLALAKNTVDVQIVPSTIGPFAGTNLVIGGVSHALNPTFFIADNKKPSAE